jgi:thiamine phosphate synthase YjbQ (UPF0047 family)
VNPMSIFGRMVQSILEINKVIMGVLLLMEALSTTTVIINRKCDTYIKSEIWTWLSWFSHKEPNQLTTCLELLSFIDFSLASPTSP